MKIFAIFAVKKKVLEGTAFADGIANPSPQAIDDWNAFAEKYQALLSKEENGRTSPITKRTTKGSLHQVFVNCPEDAVNAIDVALSAEIDIAKPANDGG